MEPNLSDEIVIMDLSMTSIMEVVETIVLRLLTRIMINIPWLKRFLIHQLVSH